MACGVTGAGAAASVAGGAEAGAAAGVWAIPAVVINPAPSAETRIRVRFIRSVVLLQEIVTTQIDFALRQHCLCDSSGIRGLHANNSLQPESYGQSMQFYCFGACGFA